MESDKLAEIVLFQCDRKTTNLYKQFLIILEELRDSKIITEDVFHRYRKKVLDYGNDAKREMREHLEKVTFTLK